MKILHINASDDPSGAYISAWQWHEFCLKKGIDSKVLVLNQKHGSRPNQYHYWDYIKSNFIEKLTLFVRRKLHDYSKIESELRDLNLQFSSPITPYRIEKHPLVKEADIIHLHQGAKMINWATFFKNLNKKILYTMHDSEPFTAGFHVMKNVQKSIEDQFQNALSDKRKIVQGKRNIFPIFPSQNHYLKSLNGVFSTHPFEVIPHLISSKDFYPMDKEIAKGKLHLDTNQKYFCFVVSELNRKGKGYDRLLELKDQIKSTNYIPICVGKSYGIEKNENWIYTEALSPKELNEVYNASDFTIQLSEEESFGLTVIESLLCNTPVLSTAVGIAPELIKNGVRLIDAKLPLLEQIKLLPKVDFDIEFWNKNVEKKYAKLLGV